MTIEHKAFVPIDLKLDESGDVTVAFSRLNAVDSDGDVTFPGALPVGKNVPMSDFNHSSWSGAKPVGRGAIRESGDLGLFEGRFFLSTTHGRDAYETVKAMAELQEWSYGYFVTDGGPGTFEGRRVRELRKLDVFEVSPVLKGAGVGTHTIAIKSGAPGTDAPYAEVASWYLEHVPAFIARTEDRVTFRKGEGRTLSQKDRDVLDAIASMFLEHAAAIKALTEPVDPVLEQRRRASLMVEIEKARSLGVPI